MCAIKWGEAYLRIIGAMVFVGNGQGSLSVHKITDSDQLHPTYRILMAPARFRASSAFSSVSINLKRPNEKKHTFQFFSFFSLLIVKYQAFQMLLFYFILHLSRASVNGQSRGRRNSKLASLKKELQP